MPKVQTFQKKENGMTPAQFIKRRKALGYSQTELAKALDISVRQISRMETSQRNVSRVMELAMKALTGNKSNPEPKVRGGKNDATH